MYENQAQLMKGAAVIKERIEAAQVRAQTARPAPSVDSPLARHACEMDEALQRLESLAANLMDRLHPVLGQVLESDGVVSGRGPGSAPILDLLGGVIGRIGAVSDRLDVTIARLVL